MSESRTTKSSGRGRSADAKPAADESAPQTDDAPTATPETPDESTSDAGTTSDEAETQAAPSQGIARPTTAGNITQTSSAAPLEPPGDTSWPQDGHTQNDPPEGIGHASTNPIADVMGVSNLAGEDHVAIVDDEGREVDLDKVFLDGGPHQTFLTATCRLWEVFQYPGTTSPTKRLFIGVPGSKQPKAKIAALKASQEKAHAQRAQRDA